MPGLFSERLPQMALSLNEAQAAAEPAEKLYPFLPGKPHA
jgi:hypothetical protein